VSDKPNVLVLFYDKKDKERIITVNREGTLVDEQAAKKAGIDVFHTTLGSEIERGFSYSGVKPTIRTASPSHEPALVKMIFNRYKENDGVRYDGIMVVAGLSCTLDMPKMILDELYNYETVKAESVDFNLKVEMKSNYYGQPKRIPFIGVPTKDASSNGHRAFFSMIEASGPRDTVCTGVEHGYAAAKLMTGMLTNKWDYVSIIVPNMTGGLGYDTGLILKAELDKWLKDFYQPLQDPVVQFGLTSFDDFVRGPKREDLSDWKPPSNILPVCIYSDIYELRKINEMANFVVGVSALERKVSDEEFVKETTGLDRVLHSRTRHGVNPANFIAKILSMQPYAVQRYEIKHNEVTGKTEKMPKAPEILLLNPNTFSKARAEKSRPNFVEYLGDELVA